MRAESSSLRHDDDDRYINKFILTRSAYFFISFYKFGHYKSITTIYNDLANFCLLTLSLQNSAPQRKIKSIFVVCRAHFTTGELPLAKKITHFLVFGG